MRQDCVQPSTPDSYEQRSCSSRGGACLFPAVDREFSARRGVLERTRPGRPGAASASRMRPSNLVSMKGDRSGKKPPPARAGVLLLALHYEASSRPSSKIRWRRVGYRFPGHAYVPIVHLLLVTDLMGFLGRLPSACLLRAMILATWSPVRSVGGSMKK